MLNMKKKVSHKLNMFTNDQPTLIGAIFLIIFLGDDYNSLIEKDSIKQIESGMEINRYNINVIAPGRTKFILDPEAKINGKEEYISFITDKYGENQLISFHKYYIKYIICQQKKK